MPNRSLKNVIEGHRKDSATGRIAYLLRQLADGVGGAEGKSDECAPARAESSSKRPPTCMPPSK